MKPPETLQRLCELTAGWGHVLHVSLANPETLNPKPLDDSGLTRVEDGRFIVSFRLRAFGSVIWEFPKIRGTLFGGPYNKDPTI